MLPELHGKSDRGVLISSPNIPDHAHPSDDALEDAAARPSNSSEADLGSDAIRAAIVRLVSNFSIEVTSSEAQKIPDFTRLLPENTQVFIPVLPRQGFDNTVSAAKRLASEGLRPVPHIAARRLESRNQLQEILAQITDKAGVESVLVIAGDTDRISGPFASSMDVLATGLLEVHGLKEIYVAGYPEGNPNISSELLVDALRWKSDYAKSSPAHFKIVSQFTFTAGEAIGWKKRLRQSDIDLPVHVGVPAPASLGTLLKYAKLCGVSGTARQLIKRGRSLRQLVVNYAPEGFITELAKYEQTQTAPRFAWAHFYTFGGLSAAARWATAIKEGRFSLKADGQGFEVLDA